MRSIRGLMVALLALAAASIAYGQGMMLEWKAPQQGAFYYPISCQIPGDRYLDSSLYDYGNDGVLDIIETIDINDLASNFLGDSISVFDGATHLLKFAIYVPGGHVYSPCFIEMDSDGKKEVFAIIRMNDNSYFYPTWFDISDKNIKYQIGPFSDFRNWGFVDIEKDSYTELLCQVIDTSNNQYFEVLGFSPLAVKPSPIGHPKAVLAKLFPSTPNPFRTSARIEYFISDQDDVLLTIFNAQGRVVRTLVNKQQKKGNYVAVWDGKTDGGTLASSGAYIYKLTLGSKVAINKQMVLLK